eukprot:Blabericola_migrator_1__3227@NODE_194_length_11541_cov_124_962524_g167_i0_p2_GENE_NODE_194_length_11541_cov_124_962524_g167_i0NODE_194_length_11541_cov_124_962524_g167_i0_p2_ORF_typecomplete_len1193_score203_07Helicase_C_2/PF13307_6/9_8e47DEAD_2/PF06733_15/4e36ResIII/PF04851_15/8e06DEAD/PF00270_29/0_00014DEAD/PF00270_29/46DEAD/PF00270_29/2_5e03AAA_11/PF13086_6/9_8e06AAA_11/PF13086_6/3_2e03AAA_22/PF13401_6/7_3AAA_22/PF13401_6/1_4PhoH/PF02562_16/0_0076PhoH/PF02562_16/2_6e03AAA_30/PF13604_6/7_6DUF2
MTDAFSSVPPSHQRSPHQRHPKITAGSNKSTFVTRKKRVLPDDYYASNVPQEKPLEYHSLTFHNLPVSFPFEPYECQTVYMNCVAEALLFKRNALLESPTGTGKTLCLLSVLLAWQNAIAQGKVPNPKVTAVSTAESVEKAVKGTKSAAAKKADQLLGNAFDALEVSVEGKPQESPKASPTASGRTLGDKLTQEHVPRIIYASRTHAQLKQVVQELRKTPYFKAARLKKLRIREKKEASKADAQKTQQAQKSQLLDIEDLDGMSCKIKACTLASRDHYCVNADVIDRAGGGLDLNTVCKQTTAKTLCRWHSGCDRALAQNTEIQERVMDLDELKESARRGVPQYFCPYYASRDWQTTCSILFVPYIYLLTPSMRDSLSIQYSKDVLVIDEAHNLESNAEEATSLELTSTDLQAVAEIITSLSEDDGHARQTYLDGGKGDNDEKDKNEKNKKKTPDLQDVLTKLKGAVEHLRSLYEYLLSVELKLTPWSNSEPIHVLSIKDLQSKLTECCLDREQMQDFLNHLSDLALILEDMGTKDDHMSNERQKQQLANAAKLQGFAFSLRNLWNPAIAACEERFRVIIREERTSVTNTRRTSIDPSRLHTVDSYRILCLWSFAPHVALLDFFKDAAKSCHCLIITSGTLKPLALQALHLGGGEIEFPVRLENTHVIKEDQLCARIIGYSGTQKAQMIMNYNRLNEAPQQYGEVGEIVLDVCRSLPRDGILVFFASYGQMRKALEIWKTSGVYNAICQWKEIFEEPSNAQQSATLLEDFKTVIDAAYGRARKKRRSLNACRLGPQASGAVFVGVFRGRMSEGMSLSDDLCRAVIIVGMPYPAMKDLRVICKKQTLDLSPMMSREAALNGKTWYGKQASMAVNQAAGRVIRHKDDWGALIFIDYRYSYIDRYNEISSWITGIMSRHRGRQPCVWSEVREDFVSFFNAKKKSAPSIPPIESNRPKEQGEDHQATHRRRVKAKYTQRKETRAYTSDKRSDAITLGGRPTSGLAQTLLSHFNARADAPKTSAVAHTVREEVKQQPRIAATSKFRMLMSKPGGSALGHDLVSASENRSVQNDDGWLSVTKHTQCSQETTTQSSFPSVEENCSNRNQFPCHPNRDLPIPTLSTAPSPPTRATPNIHYESDSEIEDVSKTALMNDLTVGLDDEELSGIEEVAFVPPAPTKSLEARAKNRARARWMSPL